MDSLDCPRCGSPMDRVDDIWYCDNDDCPASGDLVHEEPAPGGPVEEGRLLVDEG